MKAIIQKTPSDSYACPKCKTELYPFWIEEAIFLLFKIMTLSDTF